MSTDYAANVQRVGLVSLIDLQPNISYLTSSALESHFSQAELPGWQADELVQARMGANLQRKGFTVVPIARNTELLALYESDWSYPRTERIHAALFALGAQLDLDMIVLVCRNVDLDLVTKTNQKLRGYGLQKAFDTKPFVYASVYVEALDTRKQFVVGKADGFQSAPLPEAAWQREFESAKGTVALAPATRARVLELMTKIVSDAVAVAGQEAGI